MENTKTIDAEELRAWIINYISAVLDLESFAISTTAPFDSYGFDSAEAVIMAGVMEEDFDIRIDPAMVFEDPSVEGMIAAFRSIGLVH